MKVYKEVINYCDFEFWAGAKNTAEVLSISQLEQIFELLGDIETPDGMSETALNDFFWFEPDCIAELLGFSDFEELKKYNAE